MTHYNCNFSTMRAEELEKENSCMNVHDHLKGKSLEELQEISKKDNLPYVVLGININSNLNLGSMIRTSLLMGANKFIVYGRKKFDSRGCVGSDKYIEVEKVDCLKLDLTYDPDEFISFINDNNYYPIFVEQGGELLGTFDWYDITTSHERQFFGKIPCFIFGNETNGIPQNLLDTREKFTHSLTVSVPQFGVIRSFNVSTTCGIVLYSFVDNYFGFKGVDR